MQLLAAGPNPLFVEHRIAIDEGFGQAHDRSCRQIRHENLTAAQIRQRGDDGVDGLRQCQPEARHLAAAQRERRALGRASSPDRQDRPSAREDVAVPQHRHPQSMRPRARILADNQVLGHGLRCTIGVFGVAIVHYHSVDDEIMRSFYVDAVNIATTPNAASSPLTSMLANASPTLPPTG